MIVRREQPADRAAITAVHDAAFGCDPGSHSAEGRLVDALRADGEAVPELSLVALQETAVVGHVMCSRGHFDGQRLLALAPVGVLPEHQGLGVGSALMHAVLAAAEALGEPAVFLLGDPGYYRRFGFVLAEPLGLLPPVQSWSEHFQVRRFSRWDGSRRGMFHYPAAFNRL